ncbi:hypothetical protein NDU88_012953 [Pleurodeles waltl]|uniref:Uncharacterized protein n=1 Tax=Pleurodeles waltl TaxID=8319 RepID=A0AAV7R7K0_PLEWA|nr:hypothetical protein NDU88_012953 [Pleurodeles waltl]
MFMPLAIRECHRVALEERRAVPAARCPTGSLAVLPAAARGAGWERSGGGGGARVTEPRERAAAAGTERGGPGGSPRGAAHTGEGGTRHQRATPPPRDGRQPGLQEPRQFVPQFFSAPSSVLPFSPFSNSSTSLHDRLSDDLLC